MATVFVTGATGLLGVNLVRALVEQGDEVLGLARSASKASRLIGELPGVEVILGDITNVDTFADRLEGVNVLYHTAAYFRDSYKGGRHHDALMTTNVEGTRSLLYHACDRGVRNIVHISSVATIARPADGVIHDESNPSDPHEEADDYRRSKILSDQVVLEFLEEDPSLKISLIAPGWMFGPYDEGPTSSGQIIRDYLSRKLPGMMEARLPVVDARDVAQGCIAAAAHGRSGEKYLAAGNAVTLQELSIAMERVTGVPAPKGTLPYSLLFFIARMSELSYHLTGRPALLSLAAVRFMYAERRSGGYSSAKFEGELGVRFRPLDETLRDAVDWQRSAIS